MFTHQARGCLIFFLEESCLYMNARVRTWVLGFVRWQLSLYRCGCFHLWALVFVHVWWFPYMCSCFQTDVGEWGHGHGCVVVIEDHGGGGVVVMDAC